MDCFNDDLKLCKISIVLIFCGQQRLEPVHVLLADVVGVHHASSQLEDVHVVDCSAGHLGLDLDGEMWSG